MSRLQATNYILKDRAFNEREGEACAFKCSNCGAELLTLSVVPKRIKFCYCCGKKIILRSAYETIAENNKEVV